jgi:hypothetical protein
MEKIKSIANIVIEIGQQCFMYQPPGVMVMVTKKWNITITHRFYSGRTLKKRYIWNKFGTPGHLIKTELSGKNGTNGIPNVCVKWRLKYLSFIFRSI